MNISYSSYKNDIKSFNNEEYYKNLNDSILLNLFNNFIIFYKEIEDEDFKKPIFSQTTKFKKNPNNLKNYKYLKFNKENKDNKENKEINDDKSTWSYKSPVEEIDKISVLIKTNLNKISQDTYKKISVEFINELILIENLEIFKILSEEIINKCLFDNKYRNLYINLCYKIWNNKNIHNNLINIININNSYRWEKKNDKTICSISNFISEIDAKNDAFININFKKYFLNYIQQLYINKDLSLENLNEEDSFIKKKKILLMFELISINNHIKSDYIFFNRRKMFENFKGFTLD